MLSKEKKRTITFVSGKQAAILLQYTLVRDLKPYVGGYGTLY